jgi:hypothetical protein
MQTQHLETEILNQFLELAEKSGLQISAPLYPSEGQEQMQIETMLISLRALNARYDKNEAITQIQTLMDRYNIQLDQLIDKNGI